MEIRQCSVKKLVAIDVCVGSIIASVVSASLMGFLQVVLFPIFVRGSNELKAK